VVSIEKVMSYIKSGRWGEQIKYLRQLISVSASKIMVESAKNKLPSFTGSGLFSYRNADSLVKHSGYIVVDFDKLGEGIGGIRDVLIKDKYTEYLFTSCSGRGLAVMVRINDDPETHRKSFITLESYYKETYGYKMDRSCKDVSRLRFVSHDTDLYHNPNPQTLSIDNTIIEKPVDRGDLFADGSRDEDLFTLANTIKKGGGTDNLGVEVLARVIRSWGEDKQDPEIWASEKWKNADNFRDRKDEGLSRKVGDWIKDNVRPNCSFTRKDIYNELSCIDNNSKLIVRGTLSGLCEQGIVEQTGKANGIYRFVETGLKRMDLKNVQTRFFEMKWPLGIDRVARMMPKNIAVIAGAKDSGKSAMMLNIALMNKDIHRVRYISSEMAEVELRFRLDQFKDQHGSQLPIEEWDNVEFYYKQSGFGDLVVPDALNVIDFLEVHDNFYIIGSMIAEVFSKLTTGVAIIGVQKATGREFGRGGEFSQEKARIYVSLDKQKIGNRAKLVSVKTPVDMSDNPRGKICDYKLHSGCRFHVLTGWHDEEQEDTEDITT